MNHPFVTLIRKRFVPPPFRQDRVNNPVPAALGVTLSMMLLKGMCTLMTALFLAVAAQGDQQTSPPDETSTGLAAANGNKGQFKIEEPAEGASDDYFETGPLPDPLAHNLVDQPTDYFQGTGTDVLQQVIELETESNKQVDLLFDRVQKLILIQMQKSANSEPAPADTQNTRNATAKTQVADDQQPRPAVPEPSLTNSSAAEPSDSGSTQDDRPNMAAETQVLVSSSEQADRILATPPDLMALADSLIQSGNQQLALNYYQQLLAQPQSPDQQVWLEFQIANCYRQLKQLDLAMRQYRNVANRSMPSEFVDLSKFWLDHLDEKQEIIKDLALFTELTKKAKTDSQNEPANPK